jgi:hypothetical protein
MVIGKLWSAYANSWTCLGRQELRRPSAQRREAVGVQRVEDVAVALDDFQREAVGRIDVRAAAAWTGRPSGHASSYPGTMDHTPPRVRFQEYASYLEATVRRWPADCDGPTTPPLSPFAVGRRH